MGCTNNFINLEFHELDVLFLVRLPYKWDHTLYNIIMTSLVSLVEPVILVTPVILVAPVSLVAHVSLGLVLRLGLGFGVGFGN